MKKTLDGSRRFSRKQKARLLEELIKASPKLIAATAVLLGVLSRLG